jgi:uncharacterized coiled-coil protein SlyX
MTAKNESQAVQEVYSMMIDAGVKEKLAKQVSKRIFNYLEWRKLGGETLTVSDLLTEAQADFEKTKDKLNKYYTWLLGKDVKGYPNVETILELVRKDGTEVFRKPTQPSSAHDYVYSKCVSFYSHRGFEFPRKFTPKATRIFKGIEADRDHEFLKLEGEETVIDKTEIKLLFNALSPRDRAIGLCMISSSQDSGDLFKLSVGEFKRGLNGKGVRFFWTTIRNKTDEPFQTFFSVEATEAVSQYLKTERPDAKDTEPLFTVNTRNGTRTITTADIGENFRDTAKRIGIVWDNEKHQNPLRPKRLRHFFTTVCGKVGIDAIFEKQFTGHVLTVGERYNENRADLEIMYKRVEPYLSIFTGSEQLIRTTKDLAETEDTIKELKATISDVRFQRDQIKDQLEAQQIKMQREILELRERVEMFAIKPETEALLKQLGEMYKKNQL